MFRQAKRNSRAVPRGRTSIRREVLRELRREATLGFNAQTGSDNVDVSTYSEVFPTLLTQGTTDQEVLKDKVQAVHLDFNMQVYPTTASTSVGGLIRCVVVQCQDTNGALLNSGEVFAFNTPGTQTPVNPMYGPRVKTNGGAKFKILSDTTKILGRQSGVATQSLANGEPTTYFRHSIPLDHPITFSTGADSTISTSRMGHIVVYTFSDMSSPCTAYYEYGFTYTN
jgi:hypothetical protein